MREIIEKAKEYSLSEVDKYGSPPKPFVIQANEIGLRLAKQLSADENIVNLGTWLMDLKGGQALKEGKPNEHIKMSMEATKDFLKEFNLDNEIVAKIINCVEGHHRTVEWTCKEAEISANADCYKFLLPRNFLYFLHILSSREGKFEDNLSAAEAKVDEKWKVLSLDICKQELEENYKLIKQMIMAARK